MRLGFRRHFQRQHSLRWHMSLLLLVSAGAGFACSRLLLNHGWDSVLGRYPLAVLVGYVAFLLCLRIWLQWVRWQYSEAELAQFELEPGSPASGNKRERDNILDWFDVPGDADGFGCLLIALLLLVAAVLGGAWLLISDAGLLLTDIAVQFLFTGWLTRRLKYLSNAHWFQSVLSATFWPLLWTFLAALLLAVVISMVCPEASTLREALAASCRS